MRSITIITFVLFVKLVHCAHIGFSENENQQNVENNREKTEYSENILGKLKSTLRKSLQSSKKDYIFEKQRKRCDSCRDSHRCKYQGKCDLCTRYCRDLETVTLLPTPTEVPLVGSMQVYLKNEVPAPGSSESEIVSLDKANRLYTIGAFGPGPKQNLLARLMNVARKDNLDKLVVLAKPKGKEVNLQRPVIIDTANVFNAGNAEQEIDVEVRPVNANKMTGLDLDLASKIDRELDLAIERKQKQLGNGHLSNEETDKIIEDVLSMHRSQPQPQLLENSLRLGSRINAIEPTHLTTKRSVASWENNEKSLLTSNKADSLEDEDIHAKQSLKHLRKNNEIKNENGYKGDSQLAKEEYQDDLYEGDRSSIVGEGLLQYEPRPPKYDDEEISTYLNQHKTDLEPIADINQKQSTPSILRGDSLEVIDIPSYKHPKPESASLYLETKQNDSFNASVLTSTNMADHQVKNYKNEEADVQNYDHQNKQEILVALKQPHLPTSGVLNEIHNGTNLSNSREPIVGSSWFPKSWSPSAESENDTGLGFLLPKHETGEPLQIAESKTSLLNTSDFTVILKNLEKKVENIADLVKKTCGHLHSELTGQNGTIWQDWQDKTNKHDPINNAKGETVNIPDTEPTADIVAMQPDKTTKDSPTHILDHAFDQINKGSKFVVDRIAHSVNENIHPKNKDKLVGNVHDDATPVDIDRGLFEIDDQVACSKEDSDEYLGNAKPNAEQENVACSKEDSDEYVKTSLGETEKANSKLKNLQTRLNLQDFNTAPTDDTNNHKFAADNESEKKNQSTTNIQEPSKNHENPLNENVACSKESDEYLAEKSPKEFADIGNAEQNTKDVANNDEVGCSKEESDEYVAEPKKVSTLDKVASDNDETVACSKEEEYENAPVYGPGGYRNAKPHPEKASSTKHMQLPRIPALEKLLHRNHVPHHSREGLLPKLEKDKFNLPLTNLDENTNTASKPNSNFAVWDSPQKFDAEFPTENNNNQRPDVENRESQPSKPGLSFADAAPAEDEHDVRYLPASAENVPTYRKKLLPVLNQRFAENSQPSIGKAMGPDGFHMHRPKALPNWPQLPNKNDVVGVKKDSSPEDEGQSSSTKDTQNPFSIFGRVVPQFNNTEISFHRIPNNKIYFVGSGMNLPLNMKKHTDGSYQLSVDVEKLCSSCNDKKCDKKSEDEPTQSDQKEDDDAVLGLKPPTEIANTSDDHASEQLPTGNSEQKQNIDTISKNAPHYQKISVPQRGVAKIPKESELFKDEESTKSRFQRNLEQPSIFTERYETEGRQSMISKRSPKLPHLAKNEHGYKTKDNFVNSENALNLETKDTKKDVVKRRVTLVNNVLSWMKSIAVQDTDS